MKIIILLSLFIALFADKYEYQYRNNGIPSARVERSTGIVQVYSNIKKMKMTKSMIDDIYIDEYKDIKFREFKNKLLKKYPKLEYKTKDLFKWIEFNEFQKIEKLKTTREQK